MMRRNTSIILTFFWAVGCTSQLDRDWKHIDELDGRLGAVEPFDGIAAISASKTLSDSAATERDGVAKVEQLLDLMSTGEPRGIGIADVRRSTIENNLAIQSSLVSPEVAAQQLRAERAKFESTFEASVTQSRTVNPTFYGNAGQPPDTETNSFTATPGLAVPLRGGGSVTLDWTVSTDAFRTQGTPTSEAAQSSPGISLQQPLLQGAGFEYNEASIVLAATQLGEANAQTQVAVINQVVQAEIAYWQLHLAWEVLRIDLDLYRTSRELLENQRRLVEARAGSIANVYNFEVAMAASVEAVIRSETNLRQAVRGLKVIMQDPTVSLDGSVALEPTSKPRLVGYTFDQQGLVRSAMRNRAEILQLEYEQLGQTVQVMMRENEMLPQLDLNAAWNANGIGNGSSIRSANQSLFGRDDPDGWSIGVTATVPLGNEAAIANYQAAVLQRLQSIANRRQQEILVTQEVLDAIDALEGGWNSIIASDFQVRAAGRFYDAYQTLFERGEIPSSSLTQALVSLNTARIQQVTVEVNYQIDLANLAQATGCLLGHAAVDWSDDLDRERLADPDRESPADGLRTGTGNALDNGGPTLEETLDRLTPAAGRPQPPNTSGTRENDG
ncbi:MAG: hypothetical protein CMJ27_14465 [Phycisphaerae bacterium]|nr:hypothetical protein [Phycisphaerae bacterium]MAH67545.1 hypothetical protein [Phycisphaerae bacterium]OUW99721.1 MAG: hypothetical protein CBD91_08430 [Phycisphaeraceae bacterium TMED231]OUX03462.1 MAG: hypothetical protein CBD91_00075 [Phycisphaeraceae bacterium TMED231]